MTRHDTVQSLSAAGAIAIIRMEDSNKLRQTIDAIRKGGIRAIEITMTTPNALAVIEETADTYANDDEVLIGVGSVLDGPTAQQAIRAGEAVPSARLPILCVDPLDPTMPTFCRRPWMFVFALTGFLLGGALSGCGSSQPVIGHDVDRRVYLLEGQNVTEPPEIIGGYQRIDEIKSYPEAAKRDEAYGVIWLQCTVAASGVATRIQLVRGGHPSLETEAVNVLQRLEFEPAKLNNAPTRARVQIPIIFQGPYAKKKKATGGTADSTQSNRR